LSTEDQIKILKEVGVKLKENGSYIERFEEILNANPDLLFFKEFNALKSTPTEKHFSFVPLTTVDVEISFSNYKHIFSERRQRLQIENIEMLLMLYFNK
jgi:hypothetical protein